MTSATITDSECLMHLQILDTPLLDTPLLGGWVGSVSRGCCPEPAVIYSSKNVTKMILQT